MPGATVHAVVAVKELAKAKSRLTGMDPAARAALMLRMAQTTLDALHGAGLVAGTVLVTSDPQVAALGTARGMALLPDPGSGLNPAIACGLEHVWAGPASHALIVHADFLDLAPGHFDDLLRDYLSGDAQALALVACRHNAGTNAVILPRTLTFTPRFGPESLTRHLAQGHGMARQLDCPALARDIDRVEDMGAA